MNSAWRLRPCEICRESVITTTTYKSISRTGTYQTPVLPNVLHKALLEAGFEVALGAGEPLVLDVHRPDVHVDVAPGGGHVVAVRTGEGARALVHLGHVLLHAPALRGGERAVRTEHVLCAVAGLEQMHSIYILVCFKYFTFIFL